MLKKIFFVGNFTRYPDREFLKGFVDEMYGAKGGEGFVPVLRQDSGYGNKDNTKDLLQSADMIGANAVIGKWTITNYDFVRQAKIPVVLKENKKHIPDISMIGGGNDKLGEIAASFFLERNYTSVGFCSHRRTIWATERCESVRLTIEKKAECCFSECYFEESERDGRKLREWIKSLPKPVGIIAANDECAVMINEVCQNIGVRIPDEVSLLGIDDDQFLCNIIQPKLSSLHLDFYGQGKECAAMISGLEGRDKWPPFKISLRCTGVVERGSTLHHIVKDVYVKKIVDYINVNYTSNITIKEIRDLIPLSNRAIEMRFKKEMAPHSIISYLSELRVRHMCLLLRTTDLPVLVCADRSGLLDSANAGRVFKKIIGCSPSEYRKKMR